jgi:phosphohistidine phosphatase
MDLLLWRHADAADGQPDHARELTARGRQQAKRMAAWLNARLPEDAVILVSPAMRAQQTAAALKRGFTTCDAIEPGAVCADVLQAIGPFTANGTTLLVGHQPTLGQVASRLLTGVEADMSVKKAALWWITLRRGRAEPGVLRAVMTPELL